MALAIFNKDFLRKNHVLVGGDTRIVMELGQYRESGNIDFLCLDTQSFRAVRAQVSTTSLGEITTNPFELAREVICDQYGIRTVISINGISLTVAIKNLTGFRLKKAIKAPFPAECIDRSSCYITKILSLTDGGMAPAKTDFIDLLMMFHQWGAPPQEVWAEVDRHYGTTSKQKLLCELKGFITNPEQVFAAATRLQIYSPQVHNQLLNSANLWKEQLIKQ